MSNEQRGCAVAVMACIAFACGPAAVAAENHRGAAQYVAKSSSKTADKTPVRREPRKRTLTVDDESVGTISKLHVAAGTPTTLVFRVPINENGVLLADVKGKFYPPQLIERSIILVPKVDLSNHELMSLTVTLSDGTVLPFQLVTVPEQVDLQVDVEVALKERAAPDSAPALRQSIAQLQSRLDECEASAGNAGLVKVASLIIGQDLEKPQAFSVERHAIHRLDKQSRLLVEARHVYRLFEYTYLVLTVENRDPSKTWVLDRPEVSVKGEGEAVDVKIVSFATEHKALAPEETEKLVIVFATPPQGVHQRFTVALLEKNGNRHVRLEDLQL